MINSLESSISSSANVNATASITTYVEENDYIMFENSSKMKIEEPKENSNANNDLSQTTNWFNVLCDDINKLFGGKY